jgi:hypothetical protein
MLYHECLIDQTFSHMIFNVVSYILKLYFLFKLLQIWINYYVSNLIFINIIYFNFNCIVMSMIASKDTDENLSQWHCSP